MLAAGNALILDRVRKRGDPIPLRKVKEAGVAEFVNPIPKKLMSHRVQLLIHPAK